MSRLGIKIGACLVMMAGVLACLSSCIKDDFIGKGMARDYSSVTISVLLPEPVVTTPTTRAGAADFDQMNDLNVLVAEGQSIKANVFFEFDAVENGQTIGGMQVYYTDAVVEGGILRSFSLHFTKEWLNDKGLSPMCEFYLVANYGSEIGVDTVDELNALTVHTEDVPGDNAWSYIQTPSVMVGKKTSDKMGTHKHPEPDGDVDDCRIIEMELQRLAAMVTLLIDGSGLDAGVVITPTRISLHNVPTQCTIGENNSITTEPGGITPKDGAVAENGDYKAGGTFSQGINLVGATTAGWSNFSDPTRFNTTIGGHYGNTDYDDPTVQALFLYENYHGESFGEQNSDEKWKRPAGVAQNISAIENATKACSYLEVEAQYVHYDRDGGAAVASGNVSWRFFLGKDVTENFDVMRNTYYQITLELSGSALSESDVTWRVNDDVSDFAVVGDDEIVLGGGGELVCLTFTGQNQNFALSCDYEPAGADFIFLEEVKSGRLEGWNLLDNSNNVKWDTNGDNGMYELWVYVQPMNYNTWNESDGVVRKATISLKPNGPIPATSVTITQYLPLKIEVTSADVADETDQNMQSVKNMIEKYYNVDFDSGGGNNSFVMYVDRIDRDAMPWGFSGVAIDRNQYSGFENTYHLIDPPTEDDICVAHREYARQHYLPTGKSWRENEASVDLDYTRGSCMMHAAFMNQYQLYTTAAELNAAGVSTANLSQTTVLPPRPGSAEDDVEEDNQFVWCVPSIVGWQILEKLDIHSREVGDEGIFDPGYPIVPFYSYWTSNAGATNLPEGVYPNADGKTNAFVYQFGVGLHSIPENSTYDAQYLVPRNVPQPYRLISIAPDLLKSSVEGGEPEPMGEAE